MDFLTTWGAAMGIFLITGAFMQAVNRTVPVKPGDPGLRGVWYVWRRFALLPLGGALGAAGFALGLHSPLGDGMGYNVVDGLMAATAAGHGYEVVIGSAKARLKHALETKRRSTPPEGE